MRFLAVAAVLLLAGAAHAAYFRLETTTPLCFAEDVGYGSEVVLVEWSRRHASSTMDIPLTVVVTSPVSRTKVFTRQLQHAAGSFSFRPVSAEIGEYDVCFTTETAGQGRYLEVQVAMDHHDRRHHLKSPEPAFTRMKAPGGEEIFAFTDTDGHQKDTLRTHEYLARVTSEVSAVAGSLEEVKEEMRFNWGRQLRMRQTSEDTFTRVWGTSAVTIAVVATVSYLQFAFLKTFLRRKKLI